MLVPAVVLSLVAVTSFISGVFGVAGGLLLMGGLVYLLPVSQAMILHGVAQVVSNAARVIYWRRYILGKAVIQFTAASLVMAVAFAFIRFVPSKPVLLLVLGLSTVATLLLPQAWAPKMTHRGVPYLCGLAGTALILTAGVSGTFIDQFFQRAGLDRRAIVATKSAMQVLQHVLKIVYFGAIAARGIDGESLGLLAAVPLAAMVGASIARRVLERMTDQQFNWWTYRIVLVLGTYYMVDGARLMLWPVATAAG